MSMCAILIDVVLMWCFLVVTVEGGLRFRRQLEDNAIIELFNNCKCVLYYQCSPNNTVIIHGENLINVRLKEKTPTTTVKCNGGQFDGELVCCQLPDVNNTAAEPRNPVITDETTSVTPYTHQCGVQRTKINVRIITDSSEDDVTPLDGEFPWITAIYKKNKRDKWIFYCSGALIHPKVVLTANHYFHRKSAENFKIILTGNIELTTVGNAVDNERNVAEIVNHPKYYGGALHNDGALLVLEKPFESTTTNSINSICLPPVDLNMENGRCLVAGWGEGSIEDGTKVLKKVDLPLVPINKCKQQLKKTRLGQNFELHESFMCAGGEKDKDACKGDGGSPLMCLLPGETRYFHMGIVSWGIGCGTENVPGVYASTFKMRSWILEELNKRSLAL